MAKFYGDFRMLNKLKQVRKFKVSLCMGLFISSTDEVVRVGFSSKVGLGLAVSLCVYAGSSFAETPTAVVAPNPFATFDSQIAIGNTWNFGNVGGDTYQSNNVSLNVSKLFDNGVYVSVGGDQAYNSTYTNYSASNIAASAGYAFLIDPVFQVIPYAQLTRSQLSSFDTNSNINDVWYTGLAGVRLEYLPIDELKLAINGGYGVVGQNGTLSQSNGSTVYGGTLNLGAGLSYQPIHNTPWLVNVDYAYNSYAGGLINSTNQIMLSTGYGF